MNKNENVIFDWSGDGGIGNESVCRDLLYGHSADDFIQSGCDFFDEAFGRDDEAVSDLVSAIEAGDLELQSIQNEIDRLVQKKDLKERENNQLRAELQILKEKAKRADSLTINQMLALARCCFDPRYTIEAFCRLFLCVLPQGDIPMALSRKLRDMCKTLIELVEVGIDGVKRLYGYLEKDGRFPIDAFRVACTRLRWGTDSYVFTLRDRYSLAEIERTYLARPEVQKALEAERHRLTKKKKTKTRVEDRENVVNLVLDVLAEMPHARATDIDSELEARTGKSRSTVIRWRTKVMKKHHLARFAGY